MRGSWRTFIKLTAKRRKSLLAFHNFKWITQMNFIFWFRLVARSSSLCSATKYATSELMNYLKWRVRKKLFIFSCSLSLTLPCCFPPEDDTRVYFLCCFVVWLCVGCSDMKLESLSLWSQPPYKSTPREVKIFNVFNFCPKQDNLVSNRALAVLFFHTTYEKISWYF